MGRAGRSLLRSSGLRAAADDLGRGQKLRAAAGQRAALAGALPEILLTRRPQSGRAPRVAVLCLGSVMGGERPADLPMQPAATKSIIAERSRFLRSRSPLLGLAC